MESPWIANNAEVSATHVNFGASVVERCDVDLSPVFVKLVAWYVCLLYNDILVFKYLVVYDMIIIHMFYNFKCLALFNFKSVYGLHFNAYILLNAFK